MGKLRTFYLKHFIPVEIMGGHAEYVRFLIVGMARTGSNFLRGSLMSHGQIVVLGDVFREQNTIAWGIPFYLYSRDALTLYRGDPVKFLETEVFVKFPKRVSAVGFKTLYPHTHKEIWEPIWTYLGSQKNFRIIHIKRQNMLKIYLSLQKLRQKEGKWKNISDTEGGNTAIHLDYEKCRQAFVDRREWERKYDTFFEGHHKIDVLYEDLCDNYDSEMRRIQAFLNADYQVVKPLTFKQSKGSLSRDISNYQDLKARFAGTPWEGFFED